MCTMTPTEIENDDFKDNESFKGNNNDTFDDEAGDDNDVIGEELDRRWPEESGTSFSVLNLIYRRWTYSYMTRVLKKGASSKNGSRLLEGGEIERLCHDDLYIIPPRMEMSFLDENFSIIYKEENKNLKRTLWRIASPTFIPAGFCQLLTVAAQVALPLLVAAYLKILEDYPNQNVVSKGLPYAILIFVASAFNAFGNHRHRHLATQSGIVMRSSLVGAIYRHSLHLTPRGRVGITTGEVTNLVALDTQKIFEVTQEGHLIWSCPLITVIVTALLLWTIGPSALVGMAILILLIPATERITRRMVTIRHKRTQMSDKRIEIINAMLQGIKVTKLNNYEDRYQKRIKDARVKEMVHLRKELLYWAITLSITVATPVLASAGTYTTYVLSSEDNILTPSVTFLTLLLFAALRFPLNYAGRLVGRAAQAVEAVRRISRFLSSECYGEEDDIHHSYNAKATSDKVAKVEDVVNGIMEKADSNSSLLPLVTVKNGTFYVGKRDDTITMMSYSSKDDEISNNGGNCFTLSGINFSLYRQQILAVVGPVGSGKSTLMNALIGEVDCSDDTIMCLHGDSNGDGSSRSKVAYAGQIPFILNSTLRENILFGLPYEEKRYNAVLDACCLLQDIDQMGVLKDLTEIGERGVTLSGGQKQRVSLARVAYANPDIAVFDDPLSALDAETAHKIFDKLFKSTNNDLLFSSAIALVTHAAYILHRVDQIMLLVDGKMTFLGSWADLSTFQCDDPLTMNSIDAMKSAVQEGKNDSSRENDIHDDQLPSLKKLQYEHDAPEVESSKNAKKIADDTASTSSGGELMTVEERKHGLSSIKTWLLWFKHAGGIFFVFIFFILLLVDRSSYVATEWWLAKWTQASDGPVNIFGSEFPAQTEGISAQSKFLVVYAIIIFVSLIGAFVRTEWALSGGTHCSETLFFIMTSKVLQAPMSYFETTPLGRILNRFTFDVEVLDITLTQNMTIVTVATSWLTASIIVMVSILPWIIPALVPIIFVYFFLQLFFRRSGADLQRLDAVSRSPLQSMLAEGLDGAATIRIFQQKENFLRKFQMSADVNAGAMLNFLSAHRWLGVRIEILGTIVVFTCCLLVVVFNSHFGISPGFAALLITWSTNFTISLGFLVDHMAEAEAAITSIERVHSMTKLPQEKSMLTGNDYQVSSEWPTQGSLRFENVRLRYRQGLPLALDGLTFSLEPGKRCGVVGRTGAGKSTLTTALFRLVEIESGRIMLDGVDLSTLGLADVRGRQNGMAIIPQDPVLFAGTLRECVDPFGGSSDEEIMEALSSVRLSSAGRGLSILSDYVEEGGKNFSVGERQLICLARAILAKPKLLVMDEATASVDGETDAFIQQMLRKRFIGTTLLTIAHRLNTIMDYDHILVMSDGQAVEFGSPQSLLEIDGGVFAELVDSTGRENASALRAIASESPNNMIER